MKYIYLILFITIGNYKVYSQDTIFLKDLANATKNSDSVNYFKIFSKTNSNLNFTIYNLDGSIHTICNLKSINPEIKDGKYERFFRDGRTYVNGNYKENKEDGIWLYYNYAIDYIIYKEVYKDGEYIENPLFYYEDGKIKFERLIDKTNKKSYNCFDEEGKLITCEEFPDEIMPKFNGDLSEYISLRMFYPSECKKNKIEGKVIVKFYIDIDGSIQSTHIIKSVHPLLDEQAKKIVSEMPNWIPGMQRCKYVLVYYTIPLSFKLN